MLRLRSFAYCFPNPSSLPKNFQQACSFCHQKNETADVEVALRGTSAGRISFVAVTWRSPLPEDYQPISSSSMRSSEL